MLPVGQLLSQIISLMWNEVRKGLDRVSGELGSIFGPYAIGEVPSLLFGPRAHNLYTVGFDWVKSGLRSLMTIFCLLRGR